MRRFHSDGEGNLAVLGIGLILAANFLFSFIDTGSKWLALLGLPALQLAFVRYLGHLAISVGLAGTSGLSADTLRCQDPFLVLLRAVFLTASTVLNFVALRHLPLSVTSTILFSAPLLICALSWPLLRERVGMFRWSAIILGFCGVIIVIRPLGESFHWAMLLSLGAAFMFALYSILTRKLANRVSTDTQQMYAGLVGTIILAPFALLQWQNPTNSFQWLVLCSLGFFGWAGHQLLTNALRHAPANLLMPFGYSFIIYLTIWSYVVFDTLPDFWTVIGALVIVVAGLIIWARELQRG